MTSPQERRTIDQQRAEAAWRAVERLKVGSDEADNYAREAKKMPVRIITAGLGQALAFIQAKHAKKNGLENLSRDISDWAKKRLGTEMPDDNLLQAIIKADSQFLRRATNEVLAYLGWLNRFLEAKGLPRKQEAE